MRERHARKRLLTMAALAAVLIAAGATVVAYGLTGHDGSYSRPSGIPASIPDSQVNLMELSPVPVWPAPGFTLTDQDGRVLPLSAFRGKVVVLEFMDPHCTDICPILSAEFTDAYRDLGRQAGQVVFAAVNVNQYHRAVADVAGRLSARLASAYDQARVVGIDASTGMIQNAATTTVPRRSRFAAAMAERMPFADAVFDLVVVTLSASHWRDSAAGLAQISRVMAADGTLVAAGPSAARPFPPMTRRARRSTPWLPGELPTLIAACGLQVERGEPIPSVAAIADTVMVAARTTPVRRATRPVRRGATAVRPVSGP